MITTLPTSEQMLEALVYIIDDEEHNVILLERLLRKHGFHRVHGVTGAAALEELMRQQIPDLLLLDLNMPDVNGLELLGRLKDLLTAPPPVPVLVLTGDTRTDTRRAALQQGARDFVNKPFDPPEVLCRIRNLLESRMMQRLLLQSNQLLDELVQQRTEQLRLSQLDLLNRLGAAAEYRDDQTGMHVRRVSRYSALLAEAAGLRSEYCQAIFHASQLHDIGKIGIPDNILLKNGKLDPDEWVTMKSHVILGSKILQGSDSEHLRLAEEIARTHHERWDGTGYPYGLKGEEIPLSGRIVSICDVFDALTSERPYKRAWSIAEAVAEIERSSGSHFDPQLVARFHQALPHLLEVRNELGHREQPSPSPMATPLRDPAICAPAT